MPSPTNVVPRHEMFHVLVQGACIGALLGGGTILSLALMPWKVVGWVPGQRTLHDVNLTIAVLVLLAVVAVAA